MSLKQVCAATGGKWPPLVIVVASGLVGIALSHLGSLVWDTMGHMKLSSRQADLAILRHSLVEHGKRDGQYPDDLGQVLRETNLAGRIREQEFVFPAAGKPYDKKAEHFVLFYERTAHSYGPWRGRYLYFQDYWCFCLDQNSGIGEQEGGGLL